MFSLTAVNLLNLDLFNQQVFLVVYWELILDRVLSQSLLTCYQSLSKYLLCAWHMLGMLVGFEGLDHKYELSL